MMRNSLNILAVLLGIAVTFAWEADAAEGTDRALTHFKAIARGDIQAVVADYGPESELEWVGGPLDGSYRGAEEIQAVWIKFVDVQGPLGLEVLEVEARSNPLGQTVSASLVYTGKDTLNIGQVLVFRDDLLVEEIWQIGPLSK